MNMNHICIPFLRLRFVLLPSQCLRQIDADAPWITRCHILISRLRLPPFHESFAELR